MVKPYKFEALENNSSILDIDATYVIHLVNNGRYESIKNNLNGYNISKKIFILHNMGYKNSKKDKFINSPPLDLVDAYITIFKHSKTSGFKRILILEDDFVFDSNILKVKNYEKINNFISTNNFDTYMLGCIPLITLNSVDKHKKVLYSGGTHAVIYSSDFIKKVLKVDQKIIKDWDYYLTFSNKYMYHKSLCYQPFPVTENSKNWGDFDLPLSKELGKFGFNFLHHTIDENNPKEGYKMYYKHHLKIDDSTSGMIISLKNLIKN